MGELRREAGADEPKDPDTPAGDLMSDVESFTTLEACVRARAFRDPLLADAIESLGYDTLLRDACRSLQALKLQDTAPCAPILSSALRARCEANVAIASGRPEWCPLVPSGGSVDTHDPVCLARAVRDARLCASVSEGFQASCRALVQGESAACGADAVCRRQVGRWHTMLATPSPGRVGAPSTSHGQGRDDDEGRFTVRVSLTPITSANHRTAGDGSAEPVPESVLEGAADAAIEGFSSMDLSEVAKAGIIVKKAGRRTELIVGRPLIAVGATSDPRTNLPKLFLDAVLDAADLSQRLPAHPKVSRFDMDLFAPGIGRFSTSPSGALDVVDARVGGAVGSPAALELTTDLREGGRLYRCKITIESYVRDVIVP